ncbi:MULTISPECIES: IclR family transcriptional regulator [Halomonas]|uniref:Transcriptional regulator n=1 Tax=Halomonas halophila TaxID=29573 RepID=A0ABQ0U7R9_9GAMM|nr:MULTISPECIES: IclR family transcriptional regulator [Halomonas]MDR5888449.1 IclR family transcriptional regulator [Halomonas salina]WJY07634.1 IclR family transcriptional regulator [Halomonas halophila]GEK73084.1 transcriptional regulator [Halomonas halophila]
MASSLIERTLGVLDALSGDARGLPLQTLAQRLEIPKSAAHRICQELIRLGYVRQESLSAHYQLTTRLVALGSRFLASSGAPDIVQPILDRLAEESGELVRLGIIENQRQIWIAKAQGARSGLRYDPDMGREAPLFCTASGHAWLARLSNQEAIALVEAQDTGPADDYGPQAPRSHDELIDYLNRTRTHGYSWQVEHAGSARRRWPSR